MGEAAQSGNTDRVLVKGDKAIPSSTSYSYLQRATSALRMRLQVVRKNKKGWPEERNWPMSAGKTDDKIEAKREGNATMQEMKGNHGRHPDLAPAGLAKIASCQT